MRGREMYFVDASGPEDAANWMRECYASEGADRSGEPAVVVRASAPDVREVFHGDPACRHLSGAGRLDDARWMLLGDAQSVGYRPCTDCGTPTAAGQ